MYSIALFLKKDNAVRYIFLVHKLDPYWSHFCVIRWHWL